MNADMLIANRAPLPEAVLSEYDVSEEAKQHRVLLDVGGPLLTTGVGVVSLCSFLVHNSRETTLRRLNVLVWKGDITRLSADAIVNPANAVGLGCFIPSHRCVDNVIHRAAGPRLREACRAAMRDVHTLGSTPIVTAGFNTPAQHIFHVAGPQVVGAVTATDSSELEACYANCVDGAFKRSLRSIAFPCISTGLFCFPKELASHIAVNAALNAALDALTVGESDVVDFTLVFCVFDSEDVRHYLARVQEVLDAHSGSVVPTITICDGDGDGEHKSTQN